MQQRPPNLQPPRPSPWCRGGLRCAYGSVALRGKVARAYQPARPILQGALATRKPNPFVDGIDAARAKLAEVEAVWGEITSDQIPNTPDYASPPGTGEGIKRPSSKT